MQPLDYLAKRPCWSAYRGVSLCLHQSFPEQRQGRKEAEKRYPTDQRTIRRPETPSDRISGRGRLSCRRSAAAEGAAMRPRPGDSENLPRKLSPGELDFDLTAHKRKLYLRGIKGSAASTIFARIETTGYARKTAPQVSRSGDASRREGKQNTPCYRRWGAPQNRTPWAKTA